jgi:hypothetical protein
VVKGEVCKTSMQRFESARRLHILIDLIGINTRLALLDTLIVNQLRFFCYLSPYACELGCEAGSERTGLGSFQVKDTSRASQT